ncbi:MAG: hypothetical protein M3M94_05190 [Actinomycetota bacterium]|nr:hypothetical protein [Actinomycetota bacterium]
MRSFIVVTVLACVLAALVPATASAKAPPRGKYDCVISGNILFGTIVIRSGARYTHRGTRGRFTHGRARRDARLGTVYPLRFRGGTLNNMKGRWYRTTSGRFEIALRNPRSNFESIYCTRA